MSRETIRMDWPLEPCSRTPVGLLPVAGSCTRSFPARIDRHEVAWRLTLAASGPRRYSDGVETILSVVQVIICVIVVFLVLMHSGKDAGLSGAFGVGSGTGPLGGGSMVERNLNRWTVFFAILFILNAVVLLKRPWA
jgi:preprotein translocase subunit SecG